MVNRSASRWICAELNISVSPCTAVSNRGNYARSEVKQKRHRGIKSGINRWLVYTHAHEIKCIIILKTSVIDGHLESIQTVQIAHLMPNTTTESVSPIHIHPIIHPYCGIKTTTPSIRANMNTFPWECGRGKNETRRLIKSSMKKQSY